MQNVKVKLDKDKRTLYDLTLKERVKFRDILFDELKSVTLQRQAGQKLKNWHKVRDRKQYLLKYLTEPKLMYLNRQHKVLKKVLILYCGSGHHTLMLDRKNMTNTDIMHLIELLNNFKFKEYERLVLS